MSTELLWAIRAFSLALTILTVISSQAAAAEPRRFAVVPAKSEVSFTASFPLGSFTGRTSDISGEFRADPADLRQPVTGAVTVSAGGLRTGNTGRDRDMYRALATDKYPDIRFTLEHLDASFPSVTDKADVLLTLRGLLAIRGVERSIVLSGRVRLRDDKLWVRGEGDFSMTEFRVSPPKRFFLSVGDKVLVVFDVTLTTE